MKRTVLILLFTIVFAASSPYKGVSSSFGVLSNGERHASLLADQSERSLQDTSQRPLNLSQGVDVRVYPNPTADYFSVNGMEHLKEVVVINLVGREVKRFAASAQAKYDVSDLTTGLYLVRLIGDQGKAVKTIRLSKR